MLSDQGNGKCEDGIAIALSGVQYETSNQYGRNAGIAGSVTGVIHSVTPCFHNFRGKDVLSMLKSVFQSGVFA